MELNETDKSMDRMFRLGELIARLDQISGVVCSYHKEIEEICKKIHNLFQEQNDTPNP